MEGAGAVEAGARGAGPERTEDKGVGAKGDGPTKMENEVGR